MRVLINGLQAGNRSGTGRYVTGLARGLAALAAPDVTVDLVWPLESEAPEGLDGLNIIKRPGAQGRRILFDQMGIHALRGELGAEVVHYPANFGPLRKCCGLVVTVHDLGFLRHPEWFRADRALYYRYLATTTLPRAERIIADSASTAADVMHYLKIPAERIRVAPLAADGRFRPLDGAQYGALRDRYGLPERFFLYVGTVEPRKNLARLIEAWDGVADDIPQDLVIAGRAGWKTKGVAEAARKVRHGARLHFPGFVEEDELPALYGAAEALVWPSLFEGFGLPPLEAMACGTAVLAGNNSSMPEVVGDSGLLVDGRSVGAIQEGLVALAQDETLRERLAAKGLTQAARFSWARMAEETVAVYRDVAG